MEIELKQAIYHLTMAAAGFGVLARAGIIKTEDNINIQKLHEDISNKYEVE